MSMNQRSTSTRSTQTRSAQNRSATPERITASAERIEMFHRRIRPFAFLLILALGLPMLQAATPPDLLHYEGVLRDASGAPEEGSFDMIFRFFDAEVAGDEVLIDQHLAAGTGAVAVSGGLFDVALGSGDVSDGSGPGFYNALSGLFADFSEVWLEIDLRAVGAGSFETLSPRVRVQSSPYAFNATRLDGREAAEFLDTSSDTQIKAGRLAIQGTLAANGGFSVSTGSPGEGKVLTSDASGNATWRTPATVTESTLRPLADRLGVENPGDLPFAELRPFDCSGGNTAQLSLEVGGVPLAGTVTGFVGSDEISQLSRYLVTVEASGALTSSIGQDAVLTLTRNGSAVTFSGIVTEFGLAGVNGSTRTYVYRIQPRLAEGERFARHRAFFDQTTSDILSQVFGDLGVPSINNSVGSISPYEWEVQYNETDLSFVQRITGREGVHFHFQEAASGEQIVTGDSNAAFTAIPGSFGYYGDQVDPGTGEEFVATFHSREQQASETFRIGTFDDSSNNLFVRSDTVSGSVIGQVDRYDGGADGVVDLALLRAEAAARREDSRRSLHRGTGTVASMKAGHTFVLNDVNGTDFNGTYTVTEVRHYALNDSANSCVSYGNAFSALPSTVNYAPVRFPVEPRIEGLITGKVLENSDSLGRVRVALFSDLDQDDSSGWMRVATPPGRNGKSGTPGPGSASDGDWQGGYFTPEIDTEVLVGFIDGKPNAPIVIGSLYNGADLPPTSDTPSHEGLRLGPLGAGDGDASVFFKDSGNPLEEFLTFEDADNRFRLSQSLVLGSSTTATESLSFGAGGNINGGTGSTSIIAGNSLTDDLILRGGFGSSTHGSIFINGSSSMVFRPGNGLYDFRNSINSQIATLDGSGNLSLSGTGSMAALSSSSASVSGGATLGSATVNGTLDLNGNVTLDPGASINTNGQLTFGGSNLVVRLGDTVADDTVVVGDLILSESERDSSMYFYENGNNTGNYVRWDDVRADTCTGSGSVNSAFVWNIQNAASSNTAWLFANDADVEAIIDDIGSMQIDNTLTQSGACDVAEGFLGSADLDAGTVVVLDPNTPEGVTRATRALDPTVVGIVSTKPGVLLGGPTADAYPVWDELERVRGELFEVQAVISAQSAAAGEVTASELDPAVNGSDASDSTASLGLENAELPRDLAPLDPELEQRRAELQQQALDLEARLDSWRRGNVPVALVGRVPVKVTGAVEQGEYLTSSDVAGFGMALRQPGPYFAVAMESSSGGERKILALIQQGWYGGSVADPVATSPADTLHAEAGSDAGSVATLSPAGAAAGDHLTAMPGHASLALHDPSGEKEVFRVDGEGNVYARGSFRPSAMDLAEYFPVSEAVEPGDLLVIDAEGNGELKRSETAGDTAVVGIVSTVPGVLLGHGFDRILEADAELAARYELARRTGDADTAELTWQALIQRFEESHAAVAMTGTVPLKVDAAFGAIRPGDLLVSSPTPGHAMRAHEPRPGTIIGKALGALESGTGTIRVVVTLR